MSTTEHRFESASLDDLLNELIRLAGQRDVVHFKYQGKAMDVATYASFCALRDERIPELKKRIAAMATAPAQRPSADVDRAEASAFASTNEPTALLRYWFRKGFAAAMAAQEAPVPSIDAQVSDLVDYAMAVAHERELEVQGHKHDSPGAVRRLQSALRRELIDVQKRAEARNQRGKAMLSREAVERAAKAIGLTKKRGPRAKPTPSQRRVLEHLVAGRRADHHCRNRSDHGGLTGTIASLHRAGWIDDHGITAAGRAVIGAAPDTST
ncbi:hypothetical protein LMG26857_03687 [Achromobacter anxifer]|uniref:hypothetical protein n=1 Tax=Achromobacter anxifer TaxID=1287737 RepID=UPI00155BBA6C|nr:hypothetical protein [Achromobacter anxifer]CAB5514628.1 hypothetical protein LMG26857_03687 [Achromobacter anxifer]